MQIPIQNNNSSNGKKLTASEEVMQELQGHMNLIDNFEKAKSKSYFDAKTYNQSDMKENNIDINIDFTLKNKYVLGVTTIVVMSAILFTLFSGESEADKVARIAKLDYQRQEQLKENEATRQATIDCDLAIKQEMGKDNEIIPCTARTLSGSTIIPKANAMESIEVKETGDRGVGIKDTDVDCLKSFTNEQNQYDCFQSGASYVRSGKSSWGKPSQYFLDWKKNKTNSGTVAAASSVVPQSFQRTHKDEVIMESICSAAPNSPLCGKWELYARLQDITYSRYDKNSRIWEIMIGIAYAESHIGQNYTKDNVGGTCYGRNNWGGVKAKVLDSGKVIADQRLPDEYNCWLYKFDTIEDYWTTKVNIITQNYKACLSRDKPIECISGNYVGKPNVQEPNWIRNVASFLVTDEMMNVGQQ